MRISLLLIAAAVMFPLGCNTSTTGGSTNKDGGTFSLSLPTGTTDLKKGEKKVLDGCEMKRDSAFKNDVTLKVDAPKGLKATLSKTTIKKDEADTKFTITVEADKDAAIGKHDIMVSGKPDSGSAKAEGKFTVEVK